MKLAPGELKSMQQKAKQLFVGKLVIYTLGMLIPVVCATVYGYQWWIPVLMGVMLSHGTQLMHQLTHGVYSQKVDRAIGGALGFMLFENFSEYRVSHLHHHRHIGTEQYHCHPSRQPQVKGWLKPGYVIAHLFKLVFYFKTLKRIASALNGQSDIADNDRQRRLICADYRWMLLGYVIVLATVSILDAWFILIDYWFIPLIIASILHTLIEVTSHVGCQMDNTNPEFNARSIETNILMRWYSNSGCYHAEHHKYMGIPVDALKGLKDRMQLQHHYHNNGYIDLCATLLKLK
ncbi:fatty acid desaturase [Aestuariibacter sp. AA17]|uniref:Fatty acid desaturase n=1 Tax=Fluctibacter corallii TaxID=2984329 RepID=A0ABT3A8C5_9ALTE|nr:fatty acid desaturase [Aestuariibacter sp. AA17]MCV2884829.1 fatty acid desaturase [Aestuariibacter sp. AA17]